MLKLVTFLCFVEVFVLAEATKIIFPSNSDEFPDECETSDGTLGTCTANCTELLLVNGESQTCYFLEGQAYFCCKKRPAAAACEIRPRIAIVKGTLTAPKEFPYMAALGWRNPFDATRYDYKCGGVLIWEKFLLTAAHCAVVDGLEPEVVLLGGVNLNNTSESVFKVNRVIIHPDYDSEFVYHDIALLELNDTNTDKMVCLSLSDDDLLSTNLTAIGYGHTSFAGVGSDHLLKADFNIVPSNNCRKFYDAEYSMPKGIVESQLCAKDPQNSSDTCQGDSGGPLIKLYKGTTKLLRPHVVGITSLGQGCAFSPPGIYTRVSAYIDWIESIVWPNGCC